MNQISDRLRGLVQSDIRRMSRECERVGGINLGQGICDLPTIPELIDGACDARASAELVADALTEAAGGVSLGDGLGGVAAQAPSEITTMAATLALMTTDEGRIELLLGLWLVSRQLRDRVLTVPRRRHPAARPRACPDCGPKRSLRRMQSTPRGQSASPRSAGSQTHRPG